MQYDNSVNIGIGCVHCEFRETHLLGYHCNLINQVCP